MPSSALIPQFLTKPLSGLRIVVGGNAQANQFSILNLGPR